MELPTFFFKYRSYTPIPLIVILLYQAEPTLQWVITGIAVMLLGEAIRFWGVLYAGGATRTRIVGAPELVTAGPFGFVRNPLYLGNMLIYVGVALVAGGPWMWQMVVIAIAFFTWQYSQIITLEEDTLTTLFGDEYEEYREHVPRFIPRLRPWRKPGESTERLPLRKAVRPEKSTWINMGIILILIAAKWFFFVR